MIKRLIAVMLAALCMSALPFTALGSNKTPVTVKLPYSHVWKTDVPKADDRFIYRWTAETEGSPMPEGSTGSYLDWHLQGNEEGTLSLSYSLDVPGVYSYRLAAYVPHPRVGYTYEPRTYLLTVLVKTNADDEVVAEWYLLNEKEGTKTDIIDLDPSYSSLEYWKGNMKQRQMQGTDTSQEGNTSTDRKGKKGKKTRSGQSARATNTVKTGDESRIESLLVIFCVSALLIAYLVYEDLRERREKKL